jgi:multiple sugar transport system permease protein
MCAVLLNLKVHGQSIYRVLYYLPSIVPTVAGSLLVMWILNPSSGMINRVLGYIGLPGPDWLHDPLWAKPALIMLGLWGIGGTIIIYLSGLQDVPVSLLEAAQLDGASWLQRLRYVTIPMVSPITLYNLITGVIGMFQYFTRLTCLPALPVRWGPAWAARLIRRFSTAFTFTTSAFNT